MASEASDSTQVPRLIVSGDRIIPKGLRTPEVVRGVSFVVHLADGTDVVYEDDEDVRMAPADAITPSMKDVEEAHKRELELADQAIENAKQRLSEIDERRAHAEDLIARVEAREREIAELNAEVIERDRAISESVSTPAGQ